jgi:heat shock protein HtpX
MKNKTVTPTQVWLFVILTSLVFLILGSQIASRMGLFIGLFVAVTFHTLIFIWGEGLILKRFKLQPMKGRDAWGLNEKRDQWLAESKMGSAPGLWILDQELPTAFSFEAPWKKPMIAFSSGLLKNFSKPEIEAVLAHQMCHLQTRQNLKSTVSLMIANTLSRMCHHLDHLWIPSLVFEKKQKPFLFLMSPLIYFLVELSQSQQNQMAADLNAAHLVESRELLGQVLWKLEGWALTHPMDVPAATSQLFIVNPERIRQKNTLLQFHPPLQKRLEKLVGYYPI